MKNPFAYGRVVEGAGYCPRPKIEKLLAGMLESGQNVVILDEFQDVLRIKDERVALARMRSVIQFQGDLPYVFSGSSRDEMEMILSDPDSPFFKSAITIEVGAHVGLSFRNFLKRKFESTKRKVGAGLSQRRSSAWRRCGSFIVTAPKSDLRIRFSVFGCARGLREGLRGLFGSSVFA